MKIRSLLLAIALVLSGLGVASYGAYLKYEVIRPLGLPAYGDKSIFELPFLAHGDDVLVFMLENAEQLMQPRPTEPSVPTAGSVATVPSSQTSTTGPASSAPSAATTEPVCPPPDTLPPFTEPSSAAPTQPVEPDFAFPGERVDSSWFDRVLFIGNSRTCGLRGHYRNGRAEYFSDYGMTVYNYSKKRCSDKNFQDLTLEELLSSRQYDKIIINFGLNEAGYSLYSFRLAYEQMYQFVRQAQPDAVIILQSILSVTRDKYGEGEFFHPDNLAMMNQAIEQFVNGTDTFYIDANPWFTDSEGFLYESLTNDGYHLDPEALREYSRWIAHAVKELGI